MVLFARHIYNFAPGVVCLMAFSVVFVSALTAASQEPSSPGNQARVSMPEEVSRLLAMRCLECHGSLMKGELDLRTLEGALKGGETGSALKPGDAGGSFLIDQVYNEEMPPKEPLSDSEVELLEEWISEGADYPDEPLDLFDYTTEWRGGYDWWSLQALERVAPPEDTSGWSEHPIDRFVSSKLLEKGMEPSGSAMPRTLIRRATYDLTGLPPTREETDVFVRDCEAETRSKGVVGERAFAALVDRLLASDHYGERWGRHWLDVVRFGESTGFEVNNIVDELWPYRDYVIQSLNNDKPYNRFVLEQIAGDAIGAGDVDVEVGMTFLVAGAHDIVGNQDDVQAAQIRANTIDEMIRTTSESFLGLTVGCARCHDHKFDPIASKDYYSFYATFGGVYHDSREVATREQKRERRERTAPLNKRKSALDKQKSELQKVIFERAASKKDEFDAQWLRPPVDRTGTEETFDPVEAKYLRIVSEGRDNDPNSRTGYRLDEVEVWTSGSEPRNVAAARNGGKAEGRNTTPGDFSEAYAPELTIDEKFGASWIATAPTLTLEFSKPELIGRVLFSSDRPGALSATAGESTFIGEYHIEVSVDGEDWARVADSYDRKPVNDRHRRKRYMDSETTEEERGKIVALNVQLSDVRKEMSKIPVLPRRYVGRLTQPKEPFHVFIGGSPQQKGEKVSASSMKTLSQVAVTYELADDAPEQERRLALAEWIVDPSNPLTPRVLVNRLWHYHFGTGIVATPSDFGFMGGRPSHPELLDWLASEFVKPTYAVESGGGLEAWRIKRMHKLIMMSKTYRQAGTYRADSAEVDVNSRLLWRFPPRRLSAEEIRDTMLSISGSLDTRMGGPGFRLYRYLRDNVSTYVPLDTFGPETYRRSVYHQNVRASRVDLMTDFDSPDCALAAPRRVVTTSPLQALTLMNHQFTIDMAEALAERVGESNDVAGAFQLILSRDPTRAERKASKALVRDHGLDALCRTLLNTNEFVYLN